MKSLGVPAIKYKLQPPCALPNGNTPQAFAERIASEHTKWAQVVMASGVKVD